MFTNLVKDTLIIGGLAVATFTTIAVALYLIDNEKELLLEDKPIHDVLPGDMVQWDSGGTLVFPEPKAVTRIDKSNIGIYVFVEGSKSGIPIHQIVPMS